MWLSALCYCLNAKLILSSFKQPNIKTGWLKSWMLGNTFHLYLWPPIFYFLPDLSDFSAANTFVSSRHCLTYLTLAPFSTSKKGREKRQQQNFVSFSLRANLTTRRLQLMVFCSKCSLIAKWFNASLCFRDGPSCCHMQWYGLNWLLVALFVGPFVAQIDTDAA